MKIKGFILPKPKKRDFLHLSLITLAGLCLLYYLLMGIFSGFGTSILFVWLFFAIFFLLIDRLRTGHKNGAFRIPKWLWISFLIFLSVCILVFLFVEIFILTGFGSDAPENADYLIVLGAKVRKETPSLALHYRIESAYEYLSENPDTVCIASGGQGSDETMSEAECIRKILVEKGISPDRILIEDRSTNTAENLTYSRELIGDASASVVIVSNNFHVFRAKALARKAGFENVYGIGAHMPVGLLPHYLLREFVSVVVDTLWGNTKF